MKKHSTTFAIAGFSHETVTFWPGLTDLEEFERLTLHDQEVIEREKKRYKHACGRLYRCL